MTVDFKLLQKKLAENKVYDAWQFVEGLSETLLYMNLSNELAIKTFDHRKNELEPEEISPGVCISVTARDINPSQSISGIEIDDAIIMRKSVLEFFHYARLSVEVVTQILNAALFGDGAVDVNERYFPSKVSDKIKSVPQFAAISTIMDTALQNPEIKYLMEFDNYTKHVKTASFAIKNSILFGDTAEFKIRQFVFDGVLHPEENVMSKINAVSAAVENYIDDVLTELLAQIPNCQGNTNRFHTVKYKAQMKQVDRKSYLDYFYYFIEVDNGIQDLPAQISLLPLVIMADGTIKNSRVPVKKLFVTIKGQDESSICGYLEEDITQDSSEMYRRYTVHAGSHIDLISYFAQFKTEYVGTKFTTNAMDGTMIVYQE